MLGSAPVANADSPMVAGHLLSICERGAEQQFEYAQGFCRGYIRLALDLLDSRACMPKEVEAEQIRQVVTGWIAEHPERKSMRAVDAITAAMLRAYPCEPQKKR
jgi:hypothetical protein